MKIIIVGGVAGGASAAARARRVNPGAEVVIYEKGSAASFANCGLPYHLGGEITDRDKLLVASSEMFKKRFNIIVKTNHEVKKIDLKTKSIEVWDQKNEKMFVDHYDKLILATGSQLIKPSELPYQAENVFTLWSLDDLDKIKRYIASSSIKIATIIGAGFVGIEVAEQLKQLGLEVQLVELAKQVLGPLDPEMASFIQDELVEKKISLYLGDKVVESVVLENKLEQIILASGQRLKTDILIVGVGVRPLTAIAEEAGLVSSQRGAMIVDKYSRTSDLDVYAVGDMAQSLFGPTKQSVVIPLAGPANRAGRTAGEHAASGEAHAIQPVWGTSIVRVFNQVAAVTGLSEKLCKRDGVLYRVAYVSATHHASYFPGAKSLVIKLIYAPDTGKILGSQIIGEAGVDKRIDVLSTLLHFGGSVYDLASLDLSYAPPFGSAKDPLHQVAYVAMNDLNCSPELAFPGASFEGVQVVDVRSEKEKVTLPLPGALGLPIDGDVPFYENPELMKLDKNKPVMVVCHSGKRAHIVASYLVRSGFKIVKNLTGGMMVRSRAVCLSEL